MLELTLGEIVAILATAFGLPTAFTGICVWQLKRKIEKREKEEEEREKAREQNELLLIRGTSAAIALGEATARAVQRIPDAHCNGDMHAALEYATTVKHEQKDFLTKQGIHAIYDWNNATKASHFSVGVKWRVNFVK